MQRTISFILLFLAIGVFAACGDKADSGATDKNGHEDGQDHDEHGPHDGVVAKLEGGAGYLEVKLHDDKGDIELWIAKDEAFKQPIDLPTDAKVTVSFPDTKYPVATLAVRDKDKNEDEDGVATMRNGKTNYFIFPGESGQDAKWLMGADFKEHAVVKIEAGGTTYTTDHFELHPHGHHGHEHGHDDDDDHGHGERVEVGKETIGAFSVTVAVFGEIEAGHEAVLDVEVEGGAPAAVRAWVGIDSGKGSLKAKLEIENGNFHGHIEVPATLPEGSAIWVELQGEDGTKSKASFKLAK